MTPPAAAQRQAPASPQPATSVAIGATIAATPPTHSAVARGGLPDEEFYADSFTSEADKHGA